MRKISILLSVGILSLLTNHSKAHAVTLNYTHSAGSITKSYNDGNGGVFKSNPGYRFTGNGTNKIRIQDPSPATRPPNYKIWAAAGLNGWTKVFSGSSATGSATVSGFYTVTGSSPTGMGVLSGTGTYNNFIGAAGIGKLLGTGSTTITSNISVAPFTPQTPGPVPATTTLAAGFGTATAGNVNNVTVPFTNTALVPNGTYPVNWRLDVTASRTAGAVSATAAWIDLDFMWQVTAPPPPPPPVDQPTDEVPGNGSKKGPVSRVGKLDLFDWALSPENLLFDESGQLVFSSLDPNSISEPESLNDLGPSFNLGNATNLEYLSDLEVSPLGDTLALQSFAYNNGNFEMNSSALLSVNLLSGSTSPVSLSRLLDAPSAMVFGQGGFGSDLLITELGLGSGGTSTLLSVDGSGNVSTLIGDLGFENPVDIAFAPSSFGGFEDDLFILNVGDFSGASVVNNSGSILLVDDQTMTTSVFLSGLNNPLSLAFGNGTLLGDPDSTYLFVLEQGNLDPSTGLPEEKGALKAYDSSGNVTILVEEIANPSSLVVSPGGSQLFFTADNDVYRLKTTPEPTSLLSLLALGIGGAALTLKRKLKPFMLMSINPKNGVLEKLLWYSFLMV